MPKILFQDGKEYFPEPTDRAFEFQDNGDRWGNTMIKFDQDALTVAEMIQQIAPQFLDKAIAVMLNDTLAGLQQRVFEDCTLRIITPEDSLGREIIHQTYAFLIAKYMDTVSNSSARILTYHYDAKEFRCRFQGEQTPSMDAIKEWVENYIAQNSTILFLNQYQKGRALEKFPSIQQPYNKEQLDEYDEYEFLDLLLIDHFAQLADYPIQVMLKALKEIAHITVETDEEGVTIFGNI